MSWLGKAWGATRGAAAGAWGTTKAGAAGVWSSHIGKGAVVGAGLGGIYGAASDDTSILGGMAMGAVGGAAGAYVGRGAYRSYGYGKGIYSFMRGQGFSRMESLGSAGGAAWKDALRRGQASASTIGAFASGVWGTGGGLGAGKATWNFARGIQKRGILSSFRAAGQATFREALASGRSSARRIGATQGSAPNAFSAIP